MQRPGAGVWGPLPMRVSAYTNQPGRDSAKAGAGIWVPLRGCVSTQASVPGGETAKVGGCVRGPIHWIQTKENPRVAIAWRGSANPHPEGYPQTPGRVFGGESQTKTKTPGTQSLVPGVLLNYLGSKFL